MGLDGLRDEALVLLGQGLSAGAIARRLGVNTHRVCDWARAAGLKLQPGRLGGVAGIKVSKHQVRIQRRAKRWEAVMAGPFTDATGRLVAGGRAVIEHGVGAGWSLRQIAQIVGVHPSTITRELQRGREDGLYRARWAEASHQMAMRRPKASKLGVGTRLRAEVVARLDQRHSPEQIAARLVIDFPDDEEMRVSHETIYQALYVQGAGGLRHELKVTKATRQGLTRRRPRSKLAERVSGRSWIGEGHLIADRPAEAAGRAVPGHWEGDLVIGTDMKSALITLNERTTRYTLISRLDVHDSATVTQRLQTMIQQLPCELVKSLTWDQGSEMSRHAEFGIATGVEVYFCDPHSPWQRPTNENSNGLIRDFFPKSTNFTTITDEAIADAQRLLNTRPRKVLQWATPTEKLDQLLKVATTP